MAEKKGDGSGEERDSSRSSLSSSARLKKYKKYNLHALFMPIIMYIMHLLTKCCEQVPGQAAVKVKFSFIITVNHVYCQTVATVKYRRQFTDGQRDVVHVDRGVFIFL